MARQDERYRAAAGMRAARSPGRIGAMAAASNDPAPATVTVRGEASVRVEPDEATLGISLEATDAAPGPALADVAERSERLIALLDALGVPSVDRSTTGVAVQEEFEYTGNGRRSLGHRARTAIAVRMTDAELIGRALSEAVAQVQASVAGPSWTVSAGHPARLAAARLSAADARDKAQAYAEGVDARLGRLVSLTEQTPDYVGRRAAVATAAAGGGEVPIEVGQCEVTAVVQATFELG
jgi:uncharacterized protein YggE